MRSRFLILISLLLIFAQAYPSAAQDDPGQVIDAGDGTIRFTAPSGWEVFNIEGLITLYNTVEAGLALTAPLEMQPGEQLVIILTATMLETGFYDSPVENALALFEIFLLMPDGTFPFDFPEPTPSTLSDGSSYLTSVATKGNVTGRFLLVDKADGSQFAILAISHNDTDADTKALVTEMADSATAIPTQAEVEADFEVETTSTVDLVWRVDHLDWRMRTAVIVDDTLYVGNILSGIHSYNLDGDVIDWIPLITDDAELISTQDIAPGGDGTFWVADSANESLHKVTADGEVLMTIRGFDEIREPSEVETDSSGNVYSIASKETRSYLMIWNSEGELLREVDLNQRQYDVTGLAVNPDGLVYMLINDTEIMVFDAEANVFHNQFGEDAIGNAVLGGLSVLSDGTIMVVHRLLEPNTPVTILHLDADGNLLGNYSADDLGLASFNGPKSFALTPDGDVIVVDADASGGSSRIFRMSIESEE